ncbi:MAG: hypothetical protein J1F11_08285 [Oscillospiraceae bacterium]|nr:hypothetical protein [Oscillospiraceae bacterium]
MEKQSDNDIVKMELPAYEEDHSAIPDVEEEASFAENRDEIFRRNMMIAAEEDQLPAQRVKYPDNMDAEEIYPQGNVLSVHDVTEQEGVLSKIKHIFKTDPRMTMAAALFAIVLITASAVITKTASPSGGAVAINTKAYEKAEDTAKSVYSAASAGLVELAINNKVTGGSTFENKGTVFVFGDSEVNTADYLGNYFTGYVYGTYNPETFAVDYALWSAETIPDEYKRLLTAEEREALAKQGIIIGCYPERD